MTRRRLVACAAVPCVLGACQDLGLPGNIPVEEARARTPTELVAEVRGPLDDAPAPLVVDGRLWVPDGEPRVRAGAELRPVGSVGGQTVYARSWDERPYSVVFTRVEVPAPADAPTARAAMEAGREHWQAYAPVIGRSGRIPAADRLLRRDPTDGAPRTTDPEAASPTGAEPDTGPEPAPGD
jgi:hypothetical protein